LALYLGDARHQEYTCSPVELKKAFRRRSLETHPDKQGRSQEAVIRVAQAYELLSSGRLASGSGNDQGGSWSDEKYTWTEEMFVTVFDVAVDLVEDAINIVMHCLFQKVDPEAWTLAAAG